jgi:hypothetical protein
MLSALQADAVQRMLRFAATRTDLPVWVHMELQHLAASLPKPLQQ